ncbi:DNA-binding transcriptional regulator, MocR family, contains an aminotransferase domain [Paenibacillaceae bacterium GAS479]|nr:DNA-binding transcriptional regulator, MocR family, contains an aminotransferase domain [Paenibacillaceae bacterium GAS479]
MEPIEQHEADEEREQREQHGSKIEKGHLNQSESSSMRLKVEQAVLEGVRTGEWKEGERVPSVRVMAERLGVHRLTVLKAYNRLEQAGLLEAKYRSGYFVRSRDSGKGDSELGHEEHWAYAARPGYRNRSRLSDIHRMPVKYRMSEALLDPALLPNRFLASHAKEVLDQHPMVLSTYSTVMGDLSLREAMAEYFQDRYGIEVNADEIMVTSGSSQAIDLVSRALMKPGDKVMVERPTYSPAIDIFQQQGIRMLPVELTPEGFDMERVEVLMRLEKPRMFYLNPTFHNPTGYTVPIHQRKALIELAERYSCILIEDDVYYDLYFDNPPPPPMFYYDTEGFVVYIRSYSKYIAPGLRISFLLARPSVMEAIFPLKALSDAGTPLLGQKIFHSFFFSARMQEHIVKLRLAVRLRKEAMERVLARSGWQWESPDGGLNLWVRLPEGVSAELLLARGLDQSVAFVPGSICDPNGEMDNWIRLSYSLLGEKSLEEGVERLISAADYV